MAKLLLERDLAHPWNSQPLMLTPLPAPTAPSALLHSVGHLWALAQRQKFCPEVALDESPDPSLWD